MCPAVQTGISAALALSEYYIRILGSGTRALPIGEATAEPQRPRLPPNARTAFGEQVLGVAEPETRAAVEPDGVANDLS